LSYVSYVVEGYRVDVDLSETKAVAVRTSPRNLHILLSLLSKHGILHSSPQRDEYTTTYTVYVPSAYAGTLKVAVPGDLGEIGGEIDLGSLPYGAEVIGSIGYRGLRMRLYRDLGWSRASTWKLYNKGLRVTPSDIKRRTGGALEVYKAVILGSDVAGDDLRLFIDARRKFEITVNLDRLEGKLGARLNSITWFKVVDSMASFIVAATGGKRIALRDVLSVVSKSKVEEVVNKAVKYLAGIGKISDAWARKRYSVDELYEYALTPRSLVLRQALSSEGLLIRDPGRNVEVLFLPKELLTPVPSLDTLKKLFFSDSDTTASNLYGQLVEQLRLTPEIRHSEVQSFVEGLAKNGDIGLGPLKLAIDTSPLEYASVILAKPEYIEAVDKDAIDRFMRGRFKGKYPGTVQDVSRALKSSRLSDISRLWDVYEKLRSIMDDLQLVIVDVGEGGGTEGFLNSLRKELCRNIYDASACLKAFNAAVVYKRYNNINDLISNLKSDIDEIMLSNRRFKGLIIVGPEDYSYGRSVRDEIEYLASSEGVFCRYIVRKGELYYKFISALGSFVVVVPKIFSHRLKPLEISARGRKLVANSVIGIDSTKVDLERGSYRVACAITILNLSSSRYTVSSITKLNDEGEDAALADVLKDVVQENVVGDGVSVIYVNRANPKVILRNYLPKETVEKVLNKSIIVGATKTHSYSRVVKLEGYYGKPVNPEPGVCVPLRTRVEIPGMRAFLSKHLLVPIEAPANVKNPGTVMPILITTITGEKLVAYKDLERKVLDFTISLIALNNISRQWIHSLPWPLHEANRKLRTAQRLAPEPSLTIKLLQQDKVFGVL